MQIGQKMSEWQTKKLFVTKIETLYSFWDEYTDKLAKLLSLLTANTEFKFNFDGNKICILNAFYNLLRMIRSFTSKEGTVWKFKSVGQHELLAHTQIQWISTYIVVILYAQPTIQFHAFQSDKSKIPIFNVQPWQWN